MAAKLARYYNTILEPVTGTTPGRPVDLANVTVKITATGATATLFSDEDGLVPLANPVVSDSFGRYAFFVGDGIYNLEEVKAGVVNVTRFSVPIFEPRQRGKFLVSSAAQTDIVNTLTETDLYIFSLPGGTLLTDRGLQWIIAGDYLNNTGAVSTLTWRVSYGGVLIASHAFSIPQNASRRAWFLYVYLWGAGVTGQQIGHTLLNLTSASANVGTATLVDAGAVAGQFQQGFVLIVVDSILAQTLKITLQHSVANAMISGRGRGHLLSTV